MAMIDVTVGDETHTIPARWDVCGDCEGEGKTWPESLRHDVLEREEGDDEFVSDLFAGAYDVPCKTCKGRTTVLVVNEEALTAEQQEVYCEWQYAQVEEAAYHQEEAFLRRAEGGW